MTLTVDGTHSKINIVGSLDSGNETAALLADLQNLPDATQRLELIFFDALTLPAVILDAIARIKLRGVHLKITVYSNYLAHYLMRLGISAKCVHSVEAQKHLADIQAIALCGSAESLDKIFTIVEKLPAAEVAIFIVQHILADTDNLLDQLLKTRTQHYRIEMPSHLQPVQAGTIYIAPADHHMKVAHGQVYLTHDRKNHLARPSINVLFESLAYAYGPHTLAVLLCGMGDDGVEGTRRLSERGAFVIVEDSNDCRMARLLTDAAIQNGKYAHVLNIQEICSFIGSALHDHGARAAADREPRVRADGFSFSSPGEEGEPGCSDLHEPRNERAIAPFLIDLFLEAVYARYDYDYRGYQEGTLGRRIKNTMLLLQIEDFFEFQRQVLTDPEIFRRFFLEMSIEITSFFRHPEQMRLLREEVLPYLESFPNLRIWSAGCASGEEVFSLAIVLDELGLFDKARIFATDINPYALNQAQGGLFPLDKLEENRANYYKSGGTRRFDDYVENNGLYLKMSDRLRERILFHQHSLVQDGVFNEFELIICRNVMIYFKPALQQKVMLRFEKSLHPEGFLVLGTQEGLLTSGSEQRFVEYKPKSHIYRWRH